MRHTKNIKCVHAVKHHDHIIMTEGLQFDTTASNTTAAGTTVAATAQLPIILNHSNSNRGNNAASSKYFPHSANSSAFRILLIALFSSLFLCLPFSALFFITNLGATSLFPSPILFATALELHGEQHIETIHVGSTPGMRFEFPMIPFTYSSSSLAGANTSISLIGSDEFDCRYKDATGFNIKASPTASFVEFPLHLPSAGAYEFVAGTRAPDSLANSFFVQFGSDMSKILTWNAGKSKSPVPMRVAIDSPSDASQVENCYRFPSSGNFSLRLYIREPGAAVAWLNVTRAGPLEILSATGCNPCRWHTNNAIELHVANLCGPSHFNPSMVHVNGEVCEKLEARGDRLYCLTKALEPPTTAAGSTVALDLTIHDPWEGTVLPNGTLISAAASGRTFTNLSMYFEDHPPTAVHTNNDTLWAIVGVLVALVVLIVGGVLVAFFLRKTEDPTLFAPKENASASMPIPLAFVGIKQMEQIVDASPSAASRVLSVLAKLVLETAQECQCYRTKSVGDFCVVVAQDAEKILRFALCLQQRSAKENWSIHLQAADEVQSGPESALSSQRNLKRRAPRRGDASESEASTTSEHRAESVPASPPSFSVSRMSALRAQHEHAKYQQHQTNPSTVNRISNVGSQISTGRQTSGRRGTMMGTIPPQTARPPIEISLCLGIELCTELRVVHNPIEKTYEYMGTDIQHAAVCADQCQAGGQMLCTGKFYEHATATLLPSDSHMLTMTTDQPSEKNLDLTAGGETGEGDDDPDMRDISAFGKSAASVDNAAKSAAAMQSATHLRLNPTDRAQPSDCSLLFYVSRRRGLNAKKDATQLGRSNNNLSRAAESASSVNHYSNANALFTVSHPSSTQVFTPKTEAFDEQAETTCAALQALEQSTGTFTRKRVTIVVLRVHSLSKAASETQAASFRVSRQGGGALNPQSTTSTAEGFSEQANDVQLLIEEVCREHKGAVVSAIGDCTVLAFNAAFPCPNQISRAVSCALNLIDLFDELSGAGGGGAGFASSSVSSVSYVATAGIASGLAMVRAPPPTKAPTPQGGTTPPPAPNQGKSNTQIYGAVVEQATWLENYSRQFYPAAQFLAPSSLAHDLSSCSVCAWIGAAQLPGIPSCGLIAVDSLKEQHTGEADLEWMYALQGSVSTNKNPFEPLNTAFHELLSDRRKSAVAAKLLRMSSAESITATTSSSAPTSTSPTVGFSIPQVGGQGIQDQEASTIEAALQLANCVLRESARLDSPLIATTTAAATAPPKEHPALHRAAHRPLARLAAKRLRALALAMQRNASRKTVLVPFDVQRICRRWDLDDAEASSSDDEAFEEEEVQGLTMPHRNEHQGTEGGSTEEPNLPLAADLSEGK